MCTKIYNSMKLFLLFFIQKGSPRPMFSVPNSNYPRAYAHGIYEVRRGLDFFLIDYVKPLFRNYIHTTFHIAECSLLIADLLK